MALEVVAKVVEEVLGRRRRQRWRRRRQRRQVLPRLSSSSLLLLLLLPSLFPRELFLSLLRRRLWISLSGSCGCGVYERGVGVEVEKAVPLFGRG